MSRDCHPGPASRSFAITSGSSRTLICSFTAPAFGRPRPRRTNRSPSNTSAVFSMSAVSSGASSGSDLSAKPTLCFLGMGKPGGNDATGAVARCPDQNHAPLAKVSGGDEAILAIIPAAVLNGDRPAREHMSGVGEIQPAPLQRGSALGRIEPDIHLFNVSHKIAASSQTAQRQPTKRMHPS